MKRVSYYSYQSLCRGINGPKHGKSSHGLGVHIKTPLSLCLVSHADVFKIFRRSFTFWLKIEINELKLRILPFIWLALNFFLWNNDRTHRSSFSRRDVGPHNINRPAITNGSEIKEFEQVFGAFEGPMALISRITNLSSCPSDYYISLQSGKWGRAVKRTYIKGVFSFLYIFIVAVDKRSTHLSSEQAGVLESDEAGHKSVRWFSDCRFSLMNAKKKIIKKLRPFENINSTIYSEPSMNSVD